MDDEPQEATLIRSCGLIAGVLACCSTLHADVSYFSTFFDSSKYPNPDPKFQKLGDYVYYQELDGFGPLQEVAKASWIQSNPGTKGPHAITEIRMVQPKGSAGGKVSLYGLDGPGFPLTLLAESSASTVLLEGDDAVITSWDVSSFGVIFSPIETYALIMTKPMSWYSGIADIKYWNFGSQWINGLEDDPGPGFEIRGVPIPATGTGLVGAGLALLLTSRRRGR